MHNINYQIRYVAFLDLLRIGIPVRGGVTVGLLIHDERKCFGPAMNDAYSMESEDTVYPRVIINQDVFRCELSKPALYYDYILRTKDFIIRNLEAFRGPFLDGFFVYTHGACQVESA
ncbi:MAG: hypothetical protein IJZ76_11685 [Lachnospiraceae bacterium]|nr:hypothetical protein [Lachnospiraceae bacterium]